MSTILEIDALARRTGLDPSEIQHTRLNRSYFSVEYLDEPTVIEATVPLEKILLVTRIDCVSYPEGESGAAAGNGFAERQPWIYYERLDFYWELNGTVLTPEEKSYQRMLGDVFLLFTEGSLKLKGAFTELLFSPSVSMNIGVMVKGYLLPASAHELLRNSATNWITET